jgi:hypothetical protein
MDSFPFISLRTWLLAPSFSYPILNMTYRNASIQINTSNVTWHLNSFALSFPESFSFITPYLHHQTPRFYASDETMASWSHGSLCTTAAYLFDKYIREQLFIHHFSLPNAPTPFLTISQLLLLILSFTTSKKIHYNQPLKMSCFFSKFSFLNVKELTFISQDFCQSKS